MPALIPQATSHKNARQKNAAHINARHFHFWNLGIVKFARQSVLPLPYHIPSPLKLALT